MENKKINIAKLLKDCPQGMELDCTLYNTKVIYQGLNKRIPTTHPIVVQTEHGFEFELTQYGQIHNIVGSKCVIFPKGKTWEEFVPPCKFKDGDIVYFENKYGNKNKYIGIFRNIKGNYLHTYIYFGVSSSSICISESSFHVDIIREQRFATEEEKQKLFKAIKENGYKWNADTKTLEKLIVPKFKVGDRIKHRLTGEIYTVMFVLPHGGGTYEVAITNEIGKSISINEQDNYELVPNKFDISTLVPFESKVLVRNAKDDIWKPAIFGCYKDKTSSCYVLGGTCWGHCIPYEGNEHLRGKTDDCNEYYKTW